MRRQRDSRRRGSPGRGTSLKNCFRFSGDHICGGPADAKQSDGPGGNEPALDYEQELTPGSNQIHKHIEMEPEDEILWNLGGGPKRSFAENHLLAVDG